MTTTLPSFLELMAGLGLDERKTPPIGDAVPPTSDVGDGLHRRSHSHSSSCSSSTGPSAAARPSLTVPRHPHKAQSISSLRDLSEEPCPVVPVTRRSMRYSPYGPMISSRRGSLPSEFRSDQNIFTGVVRSSSTSPPPGSPKVRSRRGSVGRDNARELTISSTPISTFVRRKTPLSSPTSPTFAPRTSPPASRDTLAVPTIPTLPTLLPQPTPMFGVEHERPRSLRSSPMVSSNPLPEIAEMEPISDLPCHYTGVRASPAPGLLDEHHHGRFISPIA